MRLTLWRMKLKNRAQRLRNRWPWVAKKRLERAESRARSLEYSASEQAREIEHLKARFDEVLPKLAQLRVGPVYDRAPGTLRVQLDIEPDLVCGAFSWGDDQRMIRAFSERIGFMVERELRTANLHRFKDSRYGIGGRR